MAKKAVLVGCNYPNTKAELHGCINDVKRVHKSLVERFGFHESNITTLIDTDRRYTQPTGANIKRALNKLVTESQAGDVLFFHYSGHGVRLPAETGEDDDTGYDECIVPCDFNLINDDDFRELVDKVPQGVTLTLICDSCHSGGLINHAKEQIGESTQHGGSNAREGGFREGLRNFVSDKIHEALEDRGIDLERFSGGSRGYSRHHRHRQQDEHFQRVPYEGEGHVKSRALPLSIFLEILKQKTGKDDLDVGNIRPTLFDMFGEDSSSKVKKFVKVLFQSMLHDDDEGSGSGHHHHHGLVNALAHQFMKQKLDEVDNADEYLKPALQTPISGHEEAYAGVNDRTLDKGVLVSGCQSSETSADANPTGKANEAYGAMSNALQMVLLETDGQMTNYQLVTRMRQLLKKQGFSQHPGLYCSDYHANRIFVC